MIFMICYSHDPIAKNFNWQIHDGVNTIKRGFKTRKAARAYVTDVLKGAYK